MDVIYIDSLFFLNFIIDYLLLLATGRICSLLLVRWRMLLAAALGGVYAAFAVVLPGIFALASVKLLLGALLPVVAFGVSRRTLRFVPVFFAVSAAFGGAVYAACSLAGMPPSAGLYIPVSMPVLVLSFAVCYAVLSTVFRHSGRRSARQTAPVTVRLGARQVSFTALYDTGNELCDGVTNAPVIVVEHRALAPLFDSETARLLSGDAAENFEALSASPELRARVRLLPCSNVAAQCSLLLCFRPDEVRVGAGKTGAIIAVAPHSLSPDGEYQALI
jgi:stage II sporulation protein GA (sporulation sigma-E factor processing peptidase)